MPQASVLPCRSDRRAYTRGASHDATPYAAVTFRPGSQDHDSANRSVRSCRLHLSEGRVPCRRADGQRQRHTLSIDPRATLLDCLRETRQLTGTKKGCDHGQCGACTVHINGRRHNACLALAAAHEGDEITTIEAVGTPDKLHPMQAAFLEHDAYQCGYCTSGQIMSALSLLARLIQRG